MSNKVEKENYKIKIQNQKQRIHKTRYNEKYINSLQRNLFH